MTTISDENSRAAPSVLFSRLLHAFGNLDARSSIVLVAVLSLAAYANTIGHGFVYDDEMQILQNPWIRDLKHLPDIFSSSVWGFHSGGASNYYRPLMNMIFLGVYQLFGLQPWAFHMTSIVFHAVASVLLLLVLRRLGVSGDLPRPAPLTAAILFAVHPVHTEAVAWACGITDVSATLFFLLSWLTYEASGPKVLGWRYLASLVTFLAALLCKEAAVVLPLVLFVADYPAQRLEDGLRGRLMRLVPFAGVIAIYLLLRIHALGSLIPIQGTGGAVSAAVMLNGAVLLARYIGTLLLPMGLSAYRTFVPVSSIGEARSMVGLAVTALLAASAIFTLRRSPAALLGLALFTLPLLPVLHLPSLGSIVFAERYLYLPSAGFALFLATGLAWLGTGRPAGRAAAMAIGFVVVASWLGATVVRNGVWKNNLTLYADMVRNYPREEFPHANYAEALWNAGRKEESIAVYRTIVTSVNPVSDRAFYSLGASLESMGRLGEAADAYRRSLELNPRSYFAHHASYNLGIISFKMNRMNDAVAHLRTATILQPRNPSYHEMLGNAHGASGSYAEAAREFEIALQLSPSDGALRTKLERTRQLDGARGSSPR